MYTDVKLGEYLDALASKAPTPGGGSVAAISGATGAALISMVCNLTIGKEKFKDVEPQVQGILARAESLRADLTALVDEDMSVFGNLMIAYAMPRTTDEEKQTRTALLQERAKGSAMVPFRVAEACAAVMDLSVEAVKVGNPMAISDIGVAVLLAEAGMESAFLNVEINFNIIKDEAFVEDLKQKVASLAAGRADMRTSVLEAVRARM
jgi:methenyltetrahydrofolate cyclohydrolase